MDVFLLIERILEEQILDADRLREIVYWCTTKAPDRYGQRNSTWHTTLRSADIGSVKPEMFNAAMRANGC